MIEERGRVVAAAVRDSAVWVETVQRSGCHSCAAKSGCGTGLLGDFWASASRVKVPVPPADLNAIHLYDTVVIGIAENTLATSALIVYLLPLVALVLGALAGQALGAEHWAIIGAVVGLSVGALCVRLFSHANRHNPAMVPQFLRLERGRPCVVETVTLS
ncbi:SoxR reducing system RseC family protein [Microbulbifer bruguierae]|uniref:SoxR reducing system RseC family protein n=1 Tax=Microbulbifer bruguierae TaxID=3029061 RepID=A0ABY8NCQ6_9GAMM|nr:SoxR reducing system RseC family protein [Microbulbifer bruguierae]WGL16709.1 SoxR reducing system RseC family protein [Microbulbifer bruguierae]